MTEIDNAVRSGNLAIATFASELERLREVLNVFLTAANKQLESHANAEKSMNFRTI